MLRNKIKMSNHLGKGLILFVIVIQFVLAIPIPSYGEKSIQAITENIKKELEPRTDTERKEFNDKSELTNLIDILKKHEKDVFPFSLSINAGFIGDKAGEVGLYKVDAGVGITYNAYPHELRFNTALTAQLKNGKFQDDVATMLINYDYYLKNWIEIYGFIELSSDSYLSIQHRYEIGGGIKFETNLLSPKRKGKLELKSYKNNSGAYETFRDYIKKSPKSLEDKELLIEQIDGLENEGTRIIETLKKKYAYLSLGMAITLFYEIEKAEIETYADDIIEENGAVTIIKAAQTTKFALDGENRLRIVLRPSIIIRPCENLSIEGMHYIKYPIGSPTKVEGRHDYRTDSHVQVKLTLPKASNWAKEVSLILGYYRYYDNIPPRIPQSIIDENLAAQKSLRKTVAADTHERFVFSLEIKF